MDKDERNSTISTQIISGSLTMITVVAAFAVFIIEKREIGLGYYLTAGLAFLLFVTSIFLGGKGLSGKGKDKKVNPYFNGQAVTALFGIVMFCVSVFFGKEKKPDELEATLKEHQETIIQLETKYDLQSEKLNQVNKELQDLSNKIRETQTITKTAKKKGE